MVTAVGEMLRTDPAVGEVLTIEVAQAFEREVMPTSNRVKITRRYLFTFPPNLS
jgi:hypothetical protein